MYELVLSIFYRKQIKVIAKKSQKKFLDICTSWDKVHKMINKLEQNACPFNQSTFIASIDKRKLVIVYGLDVINKKLWLLEIDVPQPNGSLKPYKP